MAREAITTSDFWPEGHEYAGMTALEEAKARGTNLAGVLPERRGYLRIKNVLENPDLTFQEAVVALNKAVDESPVKLTRSWPFIYNEGLNYLTNKMEEEGIDFVVANGNNVSFLNLGAFTPDYEGRFLEKYGIDTSELRVLGLDTANRDLTSDTLGQHIGSLESTTSTAAAIAEPLALAGLSLAVGDIVGAAGAASGLGSAASGALGGAAGGLTTGLLTGNTNLEDIATGAALGGAGGLIEDVVPGNLSGGVDPSLTAAGVDVLSQVQDVLRPSDIIVNLGQTVVPPEVEQQQEEAQQETLPDFSPLFDINIDTTQDIPIEVDEEGDVTINVPSPTEEDEGGGGGSEAAPETPEEPQEQQEEEPSTTTEPATEAPQEPAQKPEEEIVDVAEDTTAEPDPFESGQYVYKGNGVFDDQVDGDIWVVDPSLVGYEIGEGISEEELFVLNPRAGGVDFEEPAVNQEETQELEDTVVTPEKTEETFDPVITEETTEDSFETPSIIITEDAEEPSVTSPTETPTETTTDTTANVPTDVETPVDTTTDSDVGNEGTTTDGGTEGTGEGTGTGDGLGEGEGTGDGDGEGEGEGDGDDNASMMPKGLFDDEFKPFYSGINYQVPTIQPIIQNRQVDYVRELNNVINRSLFGDMI